MKILIINQNISASSHNFWEHCSRVPPLRSATKEDMEQEEGEDEEEKVDAKRDSCRISELQIVPSTASKLVEPKCLPTPS